MLARFYLIECFINYFSYLQVIDKWPTGNTTIDYERMAKNMLKYCDGGFDISEDWDLVAIYNYNTKGYIKVILYCKQWSK